MDNQNYKELLQWVTEFFRTYHGEDSEIDANIKLKEKHTHKVVSFGKEISESLFRSTDSEMLKKGEVRFFDEEHYLLSVTSCLLHDIGRFPQFKKYRTFRDKDSFDHSLFALDIIFKYNLLKDFNYREQAIIEKAIYYHNKIEVEDSLTDEEKMVCRVVRDADKLDIYRVITEYYDDPEGNKYVFVGNDLSSEEEYTEEILEAFLNMDTINYDHVVTKNDLKLLQLAWVFDLNYDISCKIVKEEGYVRRIINYLPNDNALEEIKKILNIYL